MKDEIPTTTLKLPITGKEVVVYNYLTGGESRQLQRLILGGASIDPQTRTVSPISGSIIFDSQELAVSFLVKGYNKEEIDNLPGDDSDFLYAKIDEITQKSKLSDESKKKY